MQGSTSLGPALRERNMVTLASDLLIQLGQVPGRDDAGDVFWTTDLEIFLLADENGCVK